VTPRGNGIKPGMMPVVPATQEVEAYASTEAGLGKENMRPYLENKRKTEKGLGWWFKWYRADPEFKYQ
jgi:hypothetical protein